MSAETDSLLARSDVPLKQLPDSFSPNTTVHLRNEDWLVVRASPLLKAEFSKTRQLHLWIRKAQQPQLADAHEILFSLPTISNELPACDGQPVDGTELELHEDDWRQVEWIVNSPAVQSELDEIVRIHQTCRVSAGFRQVHIRKSVPDPLLQASLQLDSVLRWLDSDRTRIKGIRISRSARRVRDGFALQIPLGWVYGLASPQGAIHVLAFHSADPSPPPDRMLLYHHPSTVLVDWCRAHVIPAVGPAS